MYRGSDAPKEGEARRSRALYMTRCLVVFGFTIFASTRRVRVRLLGPNNNKDHLVYNAPPSTVFPFLWGVASPIN